MAAIELMQKGRLQHYGALIVISALLVVGLTHTALAETSNSDNYEASEMQFNAGTSTEESCSGQYCAEASIGDLTVGDSASTASTASFGSTESSTEPLLEVIVEPGQSDVGDLSTEETATKTMTVRVRNYLSDGYILQIAGDPPSYGGHTLSRLSTPTATDPGTEQFGINAVANTEPEVGADPVQVPSGETSFGEAAEGYNTQNLFQYQSEAVVARSTKESGRTDYTISMIINISNGTPAGRYASDFSAIVTPIF